MSQRDEFEALKDASTDDETARELMVRAYLMGRRHGKLSGKSTTIRWCRAVLESLAGPGKSGAALEADFQRWAAEELNKDRRN